MNRQARRVDVFNSEGLRLHQVNRRDAESMVGTRELAHLCRHCGTNDAVKPQCFGKVRPHVMVYVATPLYRDIHLSRASITFREMLANAGVIGSQGFQRKARAKVEFYDPTAMRRELYRVEVSHA